MSDDFEAIIQFWLGDPFAPADALKRRSRRWFTADPEVDREVESRFGALLGALSAEMIDRWQTTPRGRLGLIILLDQFPRNIYRGTEKAFSFDEMARGLSQSGITAGMDRRLEPLERMFFYMPLQHAEALEPQNQSVAMFEALVESCAPEQRGFFEISLAHAIEHRHLVQRFGRFPHRNRVMGRRSTAGELAYLEDGGKTFGQ